MQHQKPKATAAAHGDVCPAIRFPAPAECPSARQRLPRLRDLFARRWRRVVIQGRHYWLPG